MVMLVRLGTAVFPADPEHGMLVVRDVRRWVLSTLGAAHPKTGDVDLLTGEVAANALLHTASGRPGGSLRATVFAADLRVRLEITDGGGARTLPVLGGEFFGEGGRGLCLMEQIADTCGFWQDDDARTTVFFELACGA